MKQLLTLAAALGMMLVVQPAMARNDTSTAYPQCGYYDRGGEWCSTALYNAPVAVQRPTDEPIIAHVWAVGYGPAGPICGYFDRSSEPCG